MINIRRGRQDESTLLADIWCRAVDATHHFLHSKDRIDIERQVRSFLPEVSPWVAVNDRDIPVAFMLLDGNHIEALFVDPDVHGKGVGRRLIEHAMTLSSPLTTDVNEQNSGAALFYAKLGFITTGRSALDDCGRPYPLLHLRHHGS